MSVGHVAREIESSGIPTAAIYVRSFRHVAELMGLPRVVVTPHPMGRPLGAPDDAARHLEVVTAALQLFETDSDARAIVDMEGPYRPASDQP